MIRAARILPFLALAALPLTGCETGPKPPSEQNVCYNAQEQDNHSYEFYVVARDVPSLEYCAAQLEVIRLRFQNLGQTDKEVVGAYNGKFLFLDRAGVRTANSLNGGRFFALARTADGRLAVPSYIPQPAPADAGNSASAPAAPAQK